MSIIVIRNFLYNLFIYSWGIIFTSLGITMILLSNSGLGVYDTLAMSTISYIKITYGNAITAVGFLIFILTSILERKLLPITSLITIALVGRGVDAWISFLPETSEKINFSFFFIGIIIFSFGIALNIVSRIQPAPYEQFPITVAKLVKKKYIKVRVTMDIMVLLVALIMAIPFNSYSQFGIGTVFSALLLGPLVSYNVNILNKFLNRNFLQL